MTSNLGGLEDEKGEGGGWGEGKGRGGGEDGLQTRTRDWRTDSLFFHIEFCGKI